ncbi:DUF502 domain-containing protein [Oryzibacter oryziterrae]|uniref:DUF502 domain-containing protein n=1 Tax=Oryzibacter oryziterrae TaxID=2766474 RepID=UPI001F39D991|nr:DUF502 domain-containing protein [Oryzibacter oryziterrae]
MARLRNYFLTGLLVTGPAGITVYLTWSLMSWVDSWVKPYLPTIYNPDTYLPFPVPGYGLVVALIVITVIGFLTANIVGATIFSFSETLFQRMPLVRNLYNGLKQIFSSVLADRGNSFKQSVLVRFPHADVWTIGFVAGDTRGEVAQRLEGGEDMLTVYIPTTPNPTGGYLLFVKRTDVVLLEMSVEDAAKYVISFGLVTAESAEAAAGMVKSLIRKDNGTEAE